jgi:hypothetical protein
MANALYRSYKNRMLGSGSLHDPDLDADVIRATLLDSADYTPSLTTHDAYDDVAGAAKVASASLSGTAIAAGAFDAVDVTFTSVTGDQCEYLLLDENTAGADSTDPLIALFDTFDSGMPVTPNGGNIVAVFNASGIFTL